RARRHHGRFAVNWNDENWKTAAREYHERNKRAHKKIDAESQQGKGQNGGKPELIIDAGELPNVAEELRDILAKSGMLFDRGLPVRVVAPLGGGLPVATPPNNSRRRAHGASAVSPDQRRQERYLARPRGRSLPRHGRRLGPAAVSRDNEFAIALRRRLHSRRCGV